MLPCIYESMEAVSVKLNSHDEAIGEQKEIMKIVRSNVHTLANQYVNVEIILKNVQKDLENLFASSLLMSDKIESFKNGLSNRVTKLESQQVITSTFLKILPSVIKYIFYIAVGAAVFLDSNSWIKAIQQFSNIVPV